MDLLYSRYSNPLDLMRLYINQGRFGEFVTGFIEGENKRRTEEIERDTDMKLWIAYIHSESKETYSDWKKRHIDSGKKSAKTGADNNLDDDGIKAIMANLFNH